jgi:hypothetical protein
VYFTEDLNRRDSFYVCLHAGLGRKREDSKQDAL